MRLQFARKVIRGARAETERLTHEIRGSTNLLSDRRRCTDAATPAGLTNTIIESYMDHEYGVTKRPALPRSHKPALRDRSELPAVLPWS